MAGAWQRLDILGTQGIWVIARARHVASGVAEHLQEPTGTAGECWAKGEQERGRGGGRQ